MQAPKSSLITHFETEGLPPVIAQKLQGLVDVLNEPIVNMKKLQMFLGEGISDEAAILREYCWKIILGFLPEDKQEW